MVTVTILMFDYALASAVTGMSDLLYFAGKAFNRVHGESPPPFRIQLVSQYGQPVKVVNQMTLTPHCSVNELKRSDVYLVPTISGDIERTLHDNRWLVSLLETLADANCIIGSNSNGSFFLAEAGLLNDKKATTFWDNTDLFRKRYPAVDLRPDQLLVHDGNILCEAGGTSWFDLGLYLIELFCDHQTAMETAKYFMVDLERSTQLSFTPLESKKYHGDDAILETQQWMEQHYASSFSISSIGERFGLTNRTLVRRFKLATGVTPLNYLQEVRLDAASRLLVQTNKSIEKITYAIGYEDVSSFIRLFKLRTHYSPTSYRARFKAVHVAR